MSHTIDVLEEHIKELEAQIKALTRQVDVLLVKTEKLEAIREIRDRIKESGRFISHISLTEVLGE